MVDSPPHQRSPGLAPDGRRLVFTADVSGERQLFLAAQPNDSAWTRPRQLTTGGEWAGRWSPDGRAIVYCRSDGLWLIAPEGGKPRQLLRRIPPASPPELSQWSPDGRTIYYKAFEPAGWSSLWSIPAAGGTPRLLIRFDDPAHPSSRPEFATDGKRFFVTVGTRQSDIWAMELKPQR